MIGSPAGAAPAALVWFPALIVARGPAAVVPLLGACYDPPHSRCRERTDITGFFEAPAQYFRGLLGGQPRRLAEWRFAKRVCEESLAALQAVRATQPQLDGDALYEAVIAQRKRCSAAQARAILQQTYDSVEDWGNNRPPRLLEVVTYMIASEYLAATPGEKGMELDLSTFLTARIDASI